MRTVSEGNDIERKTGIFIVDDDEGMTETMSDIFSYKPLDIEEVLSIVEEISRQKRKSYFFAPDICCIVKSPLYRVEFS